MTPEERTKEINFIGTKYALLSRYAIACVRYINVLIDIGGREENEEEINEMVWRIRQIKAQQNVLDAQLARLGARAYIVPYPAITVPDELPAWLDYDEIHIEPGKTSRRKK